MIKIKTLISLLIWLSAGALTAYTAWNFSTPLVIFSSLLFFIYLLAPERQTVAYYVIGFYMMTLRGLPSSVAYYYHSDLQAVLMWTLSISVILSPYILIWSQSFKKRVLLFPLMVLVLTLPPIGIVAGANPLASAGIVFPGSGLFGIILYLGSVLILAIMLHTFVYEKLRWPVLIVIFFTLASLWQPLADPAKKFKTTVSHFLYTPAPMKAKEKRAIAEDLFRRSMSSEKDKILFFENALGDFTLEDRTLWHRLDDDKRVYAGAYMYDENKNKYDNTLLKITRNGFIVLYRQRIPFPVSMWVPLSDKGAKLHLFENPMVIDEGERVGVFICYEQILAFPFLHTMLHKPTVLLGVSNLWWGRDDTFRDAQKINLEAWASLMGVPIYYSYNERTP